jgi:hypothetical protein
MAKFIKTDRVAVEDDNGGRVWIRRKMDLGAVSTVQGATGGDQLVSLYVANILAWEGPDFRDERGKPLPCTPETIRTIDPNDPFWERVAERIAELNPREDASVPLADTTAGSTTPAAVDG